VRADLRLTIQQQRMIAWIAAAWGLLSTNCMLLDWIEMGRLTHIEYPSGEAFFWPVQRLSICILACFVLHFMISHRSFHDIG
jgi:hypothetical protein